MTSGVFANNFVGQHAPVFWVQALIEVILFHLYTLLLNPSQVLQVGYLDLLQQVHSEISHILLDIGNRVPY